MDIRSNRPMTFVKQCVVCSRELVPFRQWGVEIDCCPNCGGVWLDRGEIDAILQQARREEAAGRALLGVAGRAEEPRAVPAPA